MVIFVRRTDPSFPCKNADVIRKLSQDTQQIASDRNLGEQQLQRLGCCSASFCDRRFIRTLPFQQVVTFSFISRFDAVINCSTIYLCRTRFNLSWCRRGAGAWSCLRHAVWHRMEALPHGAPLPARLSPRARAGRLLFACLRKHTAGQAASRSSQQRSGHTRHCRRKSARSHPLRDVPN
jgi:hypothetical protein